MPKFAVGDHVERIGSLVPVWMSMGVVLRTIPNGDGVEWLNEYEVKFDEHLIATFYENQLRLVEAAGDAGHSSGNNQP